MRKEETYRLKYLEGVILLENHFVSTWSSNFNCSQCRSTVCDSKTRKMLYWLMQLLCGLIYKSCFNSIQSPHLIEYVKGWNCFPSCNETFIKAKIHLWVEGQPFLPFLTNYLEFQIRFTQAGSLWWDLQDAALAIVWRPSAKKFSKVTQKGQIWKYNFNLSSYNFLKKIAYLESSRMGFQMKLQYKSFMGTFSFDLYVMVMYGLHSTFLTGLAWWPLLGPVWSWETIFGYNLIHFV